LIYEDVSMDYATARRHMVDCQILPNKVTDQRIIDAMASLPREYFVPENRRGTSYVDEAVSVGENRYLMEPMVTARLLQHAEPHEDSLALIVGCATGYTAAVLAGMISTTVVVESNKAMAELASQTLSDLGIDNVAVMEGSLADGYPKQAPYDLIVFDGAVPEVPQTIIDQLAEGGRLVAIVGGGDSRHLGHVVVMTRFHGAVSSSEVFQAGTPMLPDFEQPAGFTF
jgi:protein-L-isoaspartate(D-aspartate) O-methyltransferase